MAGIKMTGINELRIALKKNMELNAVKRVVKQNGEEIQMKAQRNAPVDTGNLKKSIGLDIMNAGLTAKVEPTAEYAPYQEYGTRFMEAHPFVKPAFNEQKELFKSDMDKLVR